MYSTMVNCLFLIFSLKSSNTCTNWWYSLSWKIELYKETQFKYTNLAIPVAYSDIVVDLRADGLSPAKNKTKQKEIFLLPSLLPHIITTVWYGGEYHMLCIWNDTSVRILSIEFNQSDLSSHMSSRHIWAGHYFISKSQKLCGAASL